MNRENLVVRCPECEKPVAGVQQGQYRGEDDIPYAVGYTLLSCPTCQRPFLITRRGKFGYEEGDPVIFWDEPKVLYPEAPDALDKSVPRKIANSYLEARRVFHDASAYTSAAIMCRRTLEGICANRGALGRNLKDKLLDLKNKGVIEPRLHEWADEVLRELGNDAAHDVSQTISKEDAQDALEFTKAIIEYLYVFQAAYEAFKRRREARKHVVLKDVMGD